ncbi:flagellar protein FliT [Enterobacterales bacterium AW_CKDN230030176-1A_HGKHYDSX7]|uniref:flagellar protein FliT n=1 Tax=Pseudomonas entomophila TaxID=312306 RepID=UPI0015E489F5|nr:flagellar protein FliT [Pseudomonas entomophila]MBA1192531.1 flagellar protein FliT [Pseudomonas entomophila]
MNAVLERIDHTRQALLAALATRDWEAIGELDLECRVCVDEVLAESAINQQAVKGRLEDLLRVYRQLIDIASDERQSLIAEMTEIRQAQTATKVYHLFS